MASELEPEVPAIDQSLLECSAEETAGVSAETRAGTSGPRRPSPVGGPDSCKYRSFPALTWGNHRAGISGFPQWERPGEATGRAPFPSLFIFK